MPKSTGPSRQAEADPGLERLLAKRDATYEEWNANAEEFFRVEQERDAVNERLKSNTKGA